MSPDLAEQELLAESFARAGDSLSKHERNTALAGAGVFLAASALMWLAQPPRAFDVPAAALLTIVLAFCTTVRIDTPLGYTVPTQLAFVPLLFIAPASLVPLATATAVLLADLPDVVKRRLPTDRLLKAPSNAAFSLGPSAVLIAASQTAWHAGPLLLLAALVAQFAVDFLVSTAGHWRGRGIGLLAQFKESWVYAVDAALTPLALVVARAARETPLVSLALIPLIALLALFARERHERLTNLLELNNAYRGTALVLGDVVEADDGYTGEHCKSVVALALDVGKRLGLDASQSRNLEFGGLLHDVGKVAISKDIINNPGQLDEHEWAIIKTHTIEGQKMLVRVGGFMADVGQVVRSHHERWDGTGYPDQLAGRDIPIEARIITCCDSWNAMRTNRSYRKALPHDQAVHEMEVNAGSQFDPAVVEALLEVVAGELAARPGSLLPATEALVPAQPETDQTSSRVRPSSSRRYRPTRAGTGSQR